MTTVVGDTLREYLRERRQEVDAALRRALPTNRGSRASAGWRSTCSQKATHSRSFCRPSITVLPSPAGNGP